MCFFLRAREAIVPLAPFNDGLMRDVASVCSILMNGFAPGESLFGTLSL